PTPSSAIRSMRMTRAAVRPLPRRRSGSTPRIAARCSPSRHCATRSASSRVTCAADYASGAIARPQRVPRRPANARGARRGCASRAAVPRVAPASGSACRPRHRGAINATVAAPREERVVSTVVADDREGGVRLLRLDRPPANAIDESLLADLSAAVDEARADDAVRAVVLTGAGPFFGGGFDLSAPRRDARAVARLGALYREAHLGLLRLPKPTLAMVNGHAIAGGLVMALACDYRLGVEGDYRIGLNEVAIGASFPKVAFEIVRLRLPHARASEMLLGAALYPASQAIRLGVVDELLPADGFAATVLRRAARMGAFPREAYAHTKAALVAEAVARVEGESEAEAERGAAVWTAAESRAARAAQRERLGRK